MTGRGGLISWGASHLARSRAAKLVLLLLAVLTLATVAALVLPVEEKLRWPLAGLGGLGLIGVSGAYLAYRLLTFARRMAAENVALKTSLMEASAGLESIERQRFGDRSQLISEVTQLMAEAERRTNANLHALESRIAYIGDIREDFRHLQSVVGAAQGLIARTAAQGDAMNAKMSAATSSIEKLQAQLARDGAFIQSLTGGGAKAPESIADLHRRSLETEKRVDQLSSLLDAVSNERLNQMSEAQERIMGVAQSLSTGQAADRVVIARLQREIVVLTEVHASANERTKLLGEQSSETVLAIEELNGRQKQLERGLAAAIAEASATVHRLAMLDQAVREQHAAADAEGKARDARVSSELQQFKAASQQVTSAMEQRQQAFEGRLVAANSVISQSVARIDQMLEGLKSIGAEAARIASVTAQLDSRQERLAGVVDAARGELARVAAMASEQAQRLAATGKQAEDASAGLRDLAGATTTRFVRIEEQVRSVVANAESTTAGILARQDQFAAMVEKTQHKLAGVEAATDGLAAALAVSSKQSDETRARLDGLVGTTTARFDTVERQVAAALAAAENLAEETGSRLGAMIGDTKARIGNLEEQLKVATLMAESRAAGLDAQQQQFAAALEAANKRAETDNSRLGAMIGDTKARIGNFEEQLKVASLTAESRAADLDAQQQQFAAALEAANKRAETDNSRLGYIIGETTARIGLVEEQLQMASATAEAAAAGQDARLDDLSRQVELTWNTLVAVQVTADEIAAVLESSRKQSDETNGRIDGLERQTTTRLEEVQGHIKTIAAKADVAASAGDVARLAEAVSTLSERAENIASSSAEADARQSEMNVKLGMAVDNLAAVSVRAGDLDEAVSRLAASTAEIKADTAASATILTSRLEAVTAELVRAQAAVDSHASEVSVRLADLDSRIAAGAGVERISAIEADIGQIVRMVDDAEIAFADEISRLAATTAKLSEDLTLVGKNATEMPATLEVGLKAFSETTKQSLDDRLGHVERSVAHVSRLVNESEVATVAELTQLSAAIVQLKEDVRKLGETDAGDRDDSALDPLRLQLAKAASQLEEAMRDTERAIGDWDRGGRLPRQQAPAAKPKASAKAAKKKAPAKSSRPAARPPRGSKARKRR